MSVYLLEGAATEEVDLVVGVFFISYNGSVIVVYVMYSDC